MGGKKVVFLVGLLVLGILAALVFTVVRKPYFFQMHFQPVNRVGTQEKPNYQIVFLGDSMFEKLGNFDELRGYLKNYYPNKNFLLLNYGFGSTNILSAPDRLEKESSHSGRMFQAASDIPFDLIIVESFGHNPLSEYPMEEGLKRQTETLDKIVQIITQKHPRSSIIFVATIAPNSKVYAKYLYDLPPEERAKWAKERSDYIKNHIEYAKSHNIPLINIYEKSLDGSGDGNLDYINTQDFIHPSSSGIYLISDEIAKFIYQNRLLP